MTDAFVELLLFELAGALYATDASQVVRVERPGMSNDRETRLDALAEGKRALVFQSTSGEAHLRVDVVHGVRAVAIEDLRRSPPLAAMPGTMGFWLDGERPVVLIDLLQTREFEREGP